MAGALLTAASVIPFAAPVLLMLASGGFSVFFYSRRAQVRLTPRTAARVGAMGGLVGFLLMMLVVGLTLAASGKSVVDMVRQAGVDYFGANPPPQAQEVMEKLMTPAGVASIIFFGMLFMMIIVVVGSAVGGAIASSLMNRRKDQG